jgi:benzoate 4-monooxygenase
LAFDIVGDLAFGAPFGMIKAAKDFAVIPKDDKDQESAMSGEKVAVTAIPAVKILNGRGEYSMSMGVLPGWWRPYVAKLPWYRQGQQDVQTLAGIAIMAVAKRLATSTDRVDLLSKLQEARDGNGNLLGKAELTAEALTLLIAGSDTTSK